jgi:hypothetical protein
VVWLVKEMFGSRVWRLCVKLVEILLEVSTESISGECESECTYLFYLKALVGVVVRGMIQALSSKQR